jgi:hypothetical protein
MSILDVCITPSKILVGTDTVGITAGGVVGKNLSKMFPLVGANCILAFRGDTTFMHLLCVSLAAVGKFDDISVKVVDSGNALFSAMNKGAVNRPSIDQELVVARCSARACRMVGMRFVQNNLQEGFVAGKIDPHYIAPWDDSLSNFPDSDEPSAMANLAVAQLNLLRQKAPLATSGGPFVIAEIKLDGMRIWREADLGDF